MMQNKMIGQEPVMEKEVVDEGRNTEEIREIIRTIENYLVRTRETIERIEKFVRELKQEQEETIRKEHDRQEEGREDPDKEQDPPSAHF